MSGIGAPDSRATDGGAQSPQQLVERIRGLDSDVRTRNYNLTSDTANRAYRMRLMAQAVRAAGEPDEVAVHWVKDEQALVVDLSGGGD